MKFIFVLVVLFVSQGHSRECIDLQKIDLESNGNNDFQIELESLKTEVSKNQGKAAPKLFDVNQSILKFKEDLKLQRVALREIHQSQQKEMATYIDQSIKDSKPSTGANSCQQLKDRTKTAEKNIKKNQDKRLLTANKVEQNLENTLEKLDQQTGVLHDYLLNTVAEQATIAKGLEAKVKMAKSTFASIQKILQEDCDSNQSALLAGSMAGQQAAQEGILAAEKYTEYTLEKDPHNSLTALKQAKNLEQQLSQLFKISQDAKSKATALASAQKEKASGNSEPCKVIRSQFFSLHTQISQLLLKKQQAITIVHHSNLQNAETASELVNRAGNVLNLGSEITQEQIATEAKINTDSTELIRTAGILQQNTDNFCQSMANPNQSQKAVKFADLDRSEGLYNIPLGFKYVGNARACKIQSAEKNSVFQAALPAIGGQHLDQVRLSNNKLEAGINTVEAIIPSVSSGPIRDFSAESAVYGILGY